MKESPGDPPQLRIDQVEKMIDGGRLARAPLVEKHRDLARFGQIRKSFRAHLFDRKEPFLESDWNRADLTLCVGIKRIFSSQLALNHKGACVAGKGRLADGLTIEIAEWM